MDQILNQVMRPGTLVLAVAIFIATFFTRRVVELLRPNWKRKASEMEAKAMYGGMAAMWWNEIGLPAVPVVYGILTGLSHSEFLHGPLSTEKVLARLMWGGGIGWFSSILYKSVRKAILSKTGIDIQPTSGTIPPPAPEPGVTPMTGPTDPGSGG